MASRLGPVSYAEALDFCHNVRRRQILGLGEVKIDDAVETELGLWSSRVRPEALNGERSDQAASKTGASAGSRQTRRQAKDGTEA
jgi:hypothetical protein